MSTHPEPVSPTEPPLFFSGRQTSQIAGVDWPLRTVCLVLTFLLGPVGFLLHVVTRLTLRRAVATDAGPATPMP